MQSCLEKITFPRILRIKEIQQLEKSVSFDLSSLRDDLNYTYLKHKLVVDVRFRDVGVEILTLDESQEEFIHDLNVRPGDFQDRLVFLGVKRFALWCHWRRDGSKQVLGKHLHHARVHWLGDDRSVVGDIIQEFVESKPLNFFGLHVGGGVVEIKYDVALVDFLHEQILTSIWSYFVEAGQLLKLPLSLVGYVESRRVLALGGPNSLGHVLRCSL